MHAIRTYTLKLTPGSQVQLDLRGNGHLHVTTPGTIQYVKNFTPITLDLTLHRFVDDSWAYARAHAIYRYGNTGSESVSEALRHEILLEVLEAAKEWWEGRTDEERTELGFVVEVQDLEAAIKRSEEARDMLEIELRVKRSDRDAAEAACRETEAQWQSLRSEVTMLKKLQAPDYIEL